MNITNNIFDIAKQTPTRLLFIDRNKVNYQQFCTLIDQFIQTLKDAGIQKESRCIVLLPPSVNMFALTLSLFRIGAIPVMIDPGMGLKSMFKALQNTDSKFLIATPKIIPAFLLFSKQLKGIKKTLFVRKGKSGKTGLFPITRRRTPSEYKVNNPTDKDLAAIFFTSGSTGMAKGVMYQHKQIRSQLEILKNEFSYNRDEIDYCTFPLIGFFSICLGLPVALANMNMTKPSTLNPKLLIKDLNKYNCSLMFCSPMVMKKLSDYSIKRKLKLRHLKEVNIAGAAVSPKDLEKFRSIVNENCIINTPYGATEALPLTKINDRQIEIANSSKGTGVCIGKALGKTQIMIIKTTNEKTGSIEHIQKLENFEIGELMVHGPQVTQSYENNDTANSLSKVYDKNSDTYWHRMGDLGYKDEFGRIYFVGRKTHQIVIDTTVLNTIPIEHHFNKHPNVVRSGLVSVFKNNKKLAVLCIEIKHRKQKDKTISELELLAQETEESTLVKHFLVIKNLPVDPRHNAKIFREKLTLWAQKRI
jgi:acyl-CoA synthetase (AMP-forming)/AMP-acid ligase II